MQRLCGAFRPHRQSPPQMLAPSAAALKARVPRCPCCSAAAPLLISSPLQPALFHTALTIACRPSKVPVSFLTFPPSVPINPQSSQCLLPLPPGHRPRSSPTTPTGQPPLYPRPLPVPTSAQPQRYLLCPGTATAVAIGTCQRRIWVCGR